jgi:hypothetical protein
METSALMKTLNQGMGLKRSDLEMHKIMDYVNDPEKEMPESFIPKNMVKLIRMMKEQALKGNQEDEDTSSIFSSSEEIEEVEEIENDKPVGPKLPEELNPKDVQVSQDHELNLKDVRVNHESNLKDVRVNHESKWILPEQFKKGVLIADSNWKTTEEKETTFFSKGLRLPGAYLSSRFLKDVLYAVVIPDRAHVCLEVVTSYATLSIPLPSYTNTEELLQKIQEKIE